MLSDQHNTPGHKPASARRAGHAGSSKPKNDSLQELGRVLAINMGGTSTKLAIFSGRDIVHEENLTYRPPEGASHIIDELPSRSEQVCKFLKVIGVKLNKFAAVMARGGLLAPLPAGVYRVNEKMCADLKAARYGEHPSNLCGLLACDLVKGTNVPAFIADPVVVDEFPEVARVSGFPGITRASRLHALNIRAVSKLAAESLGIQFKKANFIVAHLGSGFSIATIKQGRIVDNADGMLGEGPFSVERAGVLPLRGVMKLAYTHPEEELKRLLTKKAGFAGYLGTTDFTKVLEMVEGGNAEAELAYNSMVYQVAKNIGMYAMPLAGKHHAVIITGGLAHSKRLVADLKKYIKWLGEVLVYPGENEMEALAAAAYAALSGEEPIREYTGK
jgi:butyrate kinase